MILFVFSKVVGNTNYNTAVLFVLFLALEITTTTLEMKALTRCSLATQTHHFVSEPKVCATSSVWSADRNEADNILNVGRFY